MAAGGYFVSVPVVSAERTVPPGQAKGRVHLQPARRRRAYCGFKVKDLAPLDTDWERVAKGRQCPVCFDMVREVARTEADEREGAVRERLELVEGFLQAFDHLDLVSRLVREAADRDAAHAALTEPPVGLTSRQADHVLLWPLVHQTAGARRSLEVERLQLLADLDDPRGRRQSHGRPMIAVGQAVLLVVEDDWSYEAKRRRDRRFEAMLPLPDEPGEDEADTLRRALGVDDRDDELLRYGQVCIVAPRSSPMRAWALHFCDTQLPELVRAGGLFVCDPFYDRAQAVPVPPAGGSEAPG